MNNYIPYNFNYPSRREYSIAEDINWKKEGKCDICKKIKRPVNRASSLGTLAKYYKINQSTFWFCMDCWNAMPEGWVDE